MNVLNLLFGGAAIGFGALVPLYAEERFALDPLAAGTLLTARGVGMICVAALAVLALRRLGHRIPMMVGFALLVAGLLLMAVPPPGIVGYLWLLDRGRASPASAWAWRSRRRTTPACSWPRTRSRRSPGCAACSGRAARSSRSR